MFFLILISKHFLVKNETRLNLIMSSIRINKKTEEEILVSNVRAVSGLDKIQVAEELSKASIMAISVGKNALGKVCKAVGDVVLLYRNLLTSFMRSLR